MTVNKIIQPIIPTRRFWQSLLVALGIAWQSLLVALGIAATGFVAGWIAGLSGLNSVVAASLISTTTVLAGAGGVIWSIVKFDQVNSWIGLILLVFAVSIFYGLESGVNWHRKAAYSDAVQAIQAIPERGKLLIRCSEQELLTNNYRTEVLGLEPLPFEAFCKL